MVPTLNFRQNPLFHGLTGCDITTFLATARPRTISEGSVFFRQGDQATHCHLLLSGEVKLTQCGLDGDQVVIRFVGTGEMFGWAGVMGTRDYPATAEAITACQALLWDGDAIRRGMLAMPQLAVNALELVGGRLRETQDRLRELATERVERRVARALLRLMTQSGVPAAAGIEVGFPLSRQDLAEAVGATLHTVSRILAGWEQRGIVGGGRRRLVIIDPRALRSLGSADTDL